MADILASSKYSLAHARRHLGTLKTELDVFHASGPYRQTIEFDPSGPYDIHKLKLAVDLPATLPGMAFDTVSSLRAALDQAGYSIAVAAGGHGKNAYFPFGDTKAEVESRASSRSREVPASLFKLMVDSGPFRDGNVFLWALNRLCNRHKHRFITPVAVCTGGGHIRQAYFSSVRSFSFPPRWNSEKQEMVLAVLPYRAPFTMDMQIQTFVSFADVEGLPRVPCIAALEQMATSIESLISSLEAECMALGFAA